MMVKLLLLAVVVLLALFSSAVVVELLDLNPSVIIVAAPAMSWLAAKRLE